MQQELPLESLFNTHKKFLLKVIRENIMRNEDIIKYLNWKFWDTISTSKTDRKIINKITQLVSLDVSSLFLFSIECFGEIPLFIFRQLILHVVVTGIINMVL